MTMVKENVVMLETESETDNVRMAPLLLETFKRYGSPLLTRSPGLIAVGLWEMEAHHHSERCVEKVSSAICRAI